MKITINVDCTADEARQFLGLPDVRPLQEALIAEGRERMILAMRTMEPDAMIRQWMPGGFPGMDQLQKSFWSAMTAAASTATAAATGKGEDKKS